MSDRTFDRAQTSRRDQSQPDPNHEDFLRESMHNQYDDQDFGQGPQQRKAYNRNQGYMEDVQRRADRPRVGGWGSDVAGPTRPRQKSPLYDHERNQTIGAYGDDRPGYGNADSSQWTHNDNPSRPDFTGRGPKGYQRTDQRILEDICDRLSDDPYVDASEISVTCQNGEITLEGTVDSRPTKHRVEDLVADCRGVRDIHNRIRVSTGVGERLSQAADTLKDKLTPGSGH